MIDRNCSTEARHIDIAGLRTTIAMEASFWSKTELLADREGIDWRDVAEQFLAGKPKNIGRAKWLRVAILCAEDK